MKNTSERMSDTSDSAGSSHVTMRRCTPKTQAHVSTERKRESSDIATVNIKVPPFSPDEPEIWFALLEGQFDNFGITDDHAKYNQVITNIGMQHAKEIKDIIVKPPMTHRYEKIKSELIKRLSASHERKVKQLLTHEELGDRKPSQFLRHLQDLAGPSVPEEFIRTIWSNRLPHSLQTVLASKPSCSLEELADLADRIQEVTSTTPYQVAAASSSRTSTSADHQAEIAELRNMVAQISMKLDNFMRQPRRPTRDSRPHRRASRSQSRSSSRSRSSYRRHPVCWYHWKFGPKAHKCQKPCDFVAENSTSSR